MKRILFSVAAMFFVCTHSLAKPTSQPEPFETQQVRMEMSKGEQPGFMVEIPEANRAIAEHLWEKAMRHKTKSKMERIGNEYIILATMVDRISPNPVSLYAMMLEEGKAMSFYVFVESDSVFVSEEDDMITAAAIKKELTLFAKDVFKETVKWQAKNEEGKLKELERELKSLERANEKMHKHIAVNLEEIAQHEAAVEQNNFKLRANYGVVNPPGTSTEQDEEIDRAPAPAKLDPKVKKELEKANKKLRKKVAKLKANNREEETDISMNMASQEAKFKEIEAQKAYIKQIEAKLDILKDKHRKTSNR